MQLFYNQSMATQVLSAKLYIPGPRPKVVLRPRLIERLNEALHRRLTLISAPAGFGKTTLVSEWVASCEQPVAWLSLDEGDNDPARFLTYFIAALQTLTLHKADGIAANIGEGLIRVLQSPQHPPIESILTTLLNEITTVTNKFILVLDDYHVIDTNAVDHALSFLIEHQPPQMHLVIATRQDPNLPLARLRARGQLAELRVTDLRFTSSEAAEFLDQVMGLSLSAQDIAALENRTEGWIAGLQLAAVSMQGQDDVSNFIQSFTGSHRFIMDYLIEEVLKQLPERVQTFLLRTSILDRLCGPLCEAVLLDPSLSAQETLEYLEHANLFTVALDNERRWYRYHHLFADLLRQRLRQSIVSALGATNVESSVNELHIRASQWYEDNGLDIEAFHHAAAANDIDRAERLIEGKGIPLHFRGAVITLLDWLKSLPTEVLNARPSLWWRYGSLLLVNGQTTGVAEKLDAAEAAIGSTLQGAEPDEKTRNLLGQIATARTVLALTRYQVETMFVQSRRALEYLQPESLTARATVNWTLGYAYLFSGNRIAAHQALTEAIALSQAAGDIFTIILATIALGNVQEVDNQLHQAAETYQRVLQLAGAQPLQIIYEAYLGLARIFYEWNDLETSEQYAEKSLQLARQYETVIDRFVSCEVFLARLKLARGNEVGAAALLEQAERSARQKNFVLRLPEVAAEQVVLLLRQGNREEAARLAQQHKLPIGQARVYLAQGNPSEALAILEPLHQQADENGWADERLKVMVLQAVSLHAHGEKDKAVGLLRDTLTLAEPSGFMRIFVDEGLPMVQLLKSMNASRENGRLEGYIHKLLAAFEPAKNHPPSTSNTQPLIEALSQRELEVLRLIAEGLSNREISERLFLALSTVKGHSRIIFQKLQVERRTEAVARARELGLL
jgi:ATP/maltotriose-dependent transcriptional regulator MalT